MSEFTDGTTKFIVTQSLGVLPGTVTAFSGAFKDGYPVNKNTGLVDKEWHLCDGTNGTPDLQNRFIYGGDGTNNGATGGETSVTLTVKNIPEHSHTGTTSTNGAHKHGTWGEKADGTPTYGYYDTNLNHFGSRGGADCDNPLYNTSSDGDHNHTFTTDNTGGNQPHNNMPPYYTLAFIMKL